MAAIPPQSMMRRRAAEAAGAAGGRVGLLARGAGAAATEAGPGTMALAGSRAAQPPLAACRSASRQWPLALLPLVRHTQTHQPAGAPDDRRRPSKAAAVAAAFVALPLSAARQQRVQQATCRPCRCLMGQPPYQQAMRTWTGSRIGRRALAGGKPAAAVAVGEARWVRGPWHRQEPPPTAAQALTLTPPSHC